jgi:hypothetical protein
MGFAFSSSMDYIASVSWLNVPRVVKSNDPAVKSNV